MQTYGKSHWILSGILKKNNQGGLPKQSGQ